MKKTHPDLQIESTKDLYRIVTACRTCGSKDLIMYLDLGFTPPADQFRKLEELDYPEILYPLRVLLCNDCGLSQLSHVVNPRVLYQYDYPYESSTTKTGKIHWDAFAASVIKRLDLKPKNLVIDVGSNVGTLLDSFKSQGMNVFGIDPAPNIVKIANKQGIKTMCAFFGKKSATEAVKKVGKAKVIVGTNVFAHIDDLDDVMRGVQQLLDRDGVFVFESPHFKHLVEHLEYDTIYHEHLSYLTVKPLVKFFAKYKMEIFAVEESKIHGGSIRVYIGKIGMRAIDSSFKNIIKDEEKNKLHDLKALKIFAEHVAQNRSDLMTLIEKLLAKGKTIVAVSAPAKGMTLLNYAGINNRHISFATEKARLKVGRVMPGGFAGGHVPVVLDEMLMKEQPDYALLLAWNFAEEIMKNLSEFKKRGGKFIIPIPTPRIV